MFGDRCSKQEVRTAAFASIVSLPGMDAVRGATGGIRVRWPIRIRTASEVGQTGPRSVTLEFLPSDATGNVLDVGSG